jgi:hypothetical protein
MCMVDAFLILFGPVRCMQSSPGRAKLAAAAGGMGGRAHSLACFKLASFKEITTAHWLIHQNFLCVSTRIARLRPSRRESASAMSASAPLRDILLQSLRDIASDDQWDSER